MTEPETVRQVRLSHLEAFADMCRAMCSAVEAIPPSEQQTAASVMASDLSSKFHQLVYRDPDRPASPKRVVPVTPSEVAALQGDGLPDWFVEIVNQLVAENWDGKEAVVKVPDIMSRVNSYIGHHSTTKWNKNWLNFEEAYVAAGWDVQYEKPGYNGTGQASFAFTRRRSR